MSVIIPIADTFILLFGGFGSLIIACIGPDVAVTLRKMDPELDWVQGSPMEATATATHKRPGWFRVAFLLLAASFALQIGWVWFKWLNGLG